jgi:DNA uptake protein ComE-like DNA-binding protein
MKINELSLTLTGKKIELGSDLYNANVKSLVANHWNDNYEETTNIDPITGGTPPPEEIPGDITAIWLYPVDPFTQQMQAYISPTSQFKMQLGFGSGFAETGTAIVRLYTEDINTYEKTLEQENSESSKAENSLQSAETLAESEKHEVTKGAAGYAHICGAVNSPGVYQVKEDYRVVDLVKLAGGFTEKAAEDYVNQALKVQDGQRIYIPTQKEVEELSTGEYMAGGQLLQPAVPCPVARRPGQFSGGPGPGVERTPPSIERAGACAGPRCAAWPGTSDSQGTSGNQVSQH